MGYEDMAKALLLMASIGVEILITVFLSSIGNLCLVIIPVVITILTTIYFGYFVLECDANRSKTETEDLE